MWEIVCREEIPKNDNVLNRQFLLAIKDGRPNKELWKSSFIAQAHRGKMKTLLFHDTSVSNSSRQNYLFGCLPYLDSEFLPQILLKDIEKMEKTER